MFARDNEEKRSQIWRVTVVIATLLIFGIGSYLLHKMFTENPVIGTWMSQTRDLTLTIEEDGVMHISGEIEMIDSVKYTVDKEHKTIIFTMNVNNAQEEVVDEDDTVLTSAYNYSVDQEFMTLTDVEFGEVEHFIKE